LILIYVCAEKQMIEFNYELLAANGFINCKRNKRKLISMEWKLRTMMRKH